MNDYEDLMKAMALMPPRPKAERSADGTSTTYVFTPSGTSPITRYTFVDPRTPEEAFVDRIVGLLERGGFRRADAVVRKGK